MAQWFDFAATISYLFSFVVSGLIAYTAYKSYRLTKEKKFRNFAIAFFFITMSFVVQAITNLIVYFNIQNYESIVPVISNGFIVYALFTIAGFFIFTVLSLKITDIRITVLLGVLMLIALFLSPNFLVAFHLIVMALLFSVLFHMYKNCCKRKTANPKIVFAAFSFLILAHALHIIGRYVAQVFIIGNILQFVGYFILLIAILRVK